MLAIDVGNTLIKTAVFKGDEISEIFFASTEEAQLRRVFIELFPDISFGRNEPVVVASVRKKVLEIIKKEIIFKTGLEPFICDIKTETGLTNKYLTPETLGIDRLITSTAAWRLYRQQGRPVITVDMGTATTIDMVTDKGSFIGGVITPGLISAFNGLLEDAPELPDIKIEKVERLIGRTTKECMLSGAVAAHAAKIRGLCGMMAPEAVVVVTGGLLNVLSNWLEDSYILDEHLLFKGLKLIYEYNTIQRKAEP